MWVQTLGVWNLRYTAVRTVEHGCVPWYTRVQFPKVVPSPIIGSLHWYLWILPHVDFTCLFSIMVWHKDDVESNAYSGALKIMWVTENLVSYIIVIRSHQELLLSNQCCQVINLATLGAKQQFLMCQTCVVPVDPSSSRFTKTLVAAQWIINWIYKFFDSDIVFAF